jgi:hypothetical protein
MGKLRAVLVVAAKVFRWRLCRLEAVIRVALERLASVASGGVPAESRDQRLALPLLNGLV